MAAVAVVAGGVCVGVVPAPAAAVEDTVTAGVPFWSQTTWWGDNPWTASATVDACTASFLWGQGGGVSAQGTMFTTGGMWSMGAAGSQWCETGSVTGGSGTIDALNISSSGGLHAFGYVTTSDGDTRPGFARVGFSVEFTRQGYQVTGAGTMQFAIYVDDDCDEVLDEAFETCGDAGSTLVASAQGIPARLDFTIANPLLGVPWPTGGGAVQSSPA